MSNTRKFISPVRVGNLTGDPLETDTGTLYFDTSLDVLKFRNSTDYKAVLGSVQDDSTPTLGGPLNVNNNPIVNPAGDIVLAPSTTTVKRADQAALGNYIEEQYIHEILLDANQTDMAVPLLSMNPTVHEMMEITYKMKDSLGAIRGGTVLLVSDGVSSTTFDGPSVETGMISITFNGGIQVVGAAFAEFQGQVAGMTTDVTITADNIGVVGNSIILNFNGIDNITTVLGAWNAANPANTATLTVGIGTQVPDSGAVIQLINGNDGVMLAVLTYTSGTETATVRADVKRILA